MFKRLAAFFFVVALPLAGADDSGSCASGWVGGSSGEFDPGVRVCDSAVVCEFIPAYLAGKLMRLPGLHLF